MVSYRIIGYGCYGAYGFFNRVVIPHVPTETNVRQFRIANSRILYSRLSRGLFDSYWNFEYSNTPPRFRVQAAVAL